MARGGGRVESRGKNTRTQGHKNILKRLIVIFRRRWPEAALLLGFQAGLVILVEDVSRKSQAEQLSAGSGFALIFGMTALAVLWEILFLGFLRTAATQGARPADPIQLLAEGRGFFWRVVLYQAILSIGYIGLVSLMLAGLSGAMKIDDIEKMPQWAMQAASLSAIVLLIKPMLVVPAAMIVRDCSVMAAVRAMRQYLMLRDRGFMILAAVSLAVVVIAAFAVAAAGGGGAYYAVVMICGLATGAAMLTMFLAVVLRFEQDRRRQQMENEQ